jgi:NADP-dependent 3-hydroxy acid dehydrogenase YdfG
MRKTILITGASTGIGKVTAKYFQEKGWNVVATMRSPENETELDKLDNVEVVKLDVLDLESIDSAVKHGIEKFGKIDVLLNNAGYGAFGPVELTPREKIVRQFGVNVIGLIDVTKAVLPHFRERRDGVIINVSSVAGKITFPLGTFYHGTKFAVEGISEAMVYEMGEIGVKMKIVEPGAIKTDFGGRSLDFSNDESVEEYQGVIGKLIAAWEGLTKDAAEASLCAEVIYEAATDGTDQLRYLAGEDAKQYIATRTNLSDDEYMAVMKETFGL